LLILVELTMIMVYGRLDRHGDTGRIDKGANISGMNDFVKMMDS
jgi:hypothetical protein